MPITPGQTYRSADPRDLIRIRIKSYTPGENRALVVDAATGKRPRPMLVTALHESPTTQAGKPRRSGYVLEEAARTASGQQPETCSVCGCPFPVGHICRGHDQPDPTTADDPTPLRWGLGDVLWGDDDTVTVCLSGPDREPYWLELDPEQAAVLRDDLAGPAYYDARLTAPMTTTAAAELRDRIETGTAAHRAVGQPAEAQAADRAAVLDEAIKAVLGRVQAWEGMGDTVVRLNRERSAIADMLRRMAEEVGS